MTTKIEFLKPNGRPLLSINLEPNVTAVLRKFSKTQGISIQETASNAIREVMLERCQRR